MFVGDKHLFDTDHRIGVDHIIVPHVGLVVRSVQVKSIRDRNNCVIYGHSGDNVIKH